MSHATAGPDGVRMTVPTVQVPPEIMRDLDSSGLRPGDMKIRRLGEAERQATNCASSAFGYVIPYFEMNGDAMPFYRVKLVNSKDTDGIKYRQLKGAPNHIYFPLGLQECLRSWLRRYPNNPLIVITEGEKKATCAVKHGIPCVGLGGVDSWRSRTLILPKDVELTSSKKAIRARLPSGDNNITELQTLAKGFGSLLDAVTQYNLTPVIIFDSDKGGTLKAEVQRAATSLAYELRHLGLPSSKIKQVILPDVFGEAGEKTGLDDYLLAEGAKPLIESLLQAYSDPTKFPKHPNPKGFISLQLNAPMSRKDAQQIASVILAEMDAMGVRFKESNTGDPYYYDRATHKLIPAQLLTKDGNVLHETPFGQYLYRTFGLSAADRTVLVWLASQFTGEDPISDVTPRRVRTLITEADDPQNPHGLAIQTSDSTFLSVSPNPSKPVALCTNGTMGLLFEQDQVEPVDVDRVLDYFEQFNSERNLKPWWRDVIEDTNLGKTIGDKREDEETGKVTERGLRMRKYATLLYYISPYLNRWRGVQLPVELMVGEAGSGKSSLFNLRLSILTGRPILRNAPNDLRDWFASITNSGGLHVTDNVNFTRKDIKQRISDEVCRLITEPKPAVEMRELFTTTKLVRIPVDVTFAFTAVQQPFQAPDLFSRAAIFETCILGKPPEGDWVQRKLDEYGGREAWLAHHLVFMHRFLRLTEDEGSEGWRNDFVTSNRLANLEQTLHFAGRVLGLDTGFLRDTIRDVQTSALTETDWTLQGLAEFVHEARLKDPTARFSTSDISNWAVEHEEYSENPQLNNARKLGRYFKSHFSVLSEVLGITMGAVMGNKQHYKFDPSWAKRQLERERISSQK